jgi:phosphoribosylglycinamide formyltransferase-1
MMRTLVMVSGGGTNLQAIIDAQIPNTDIVAVLSDNPQAFGLERAATAGIAGITVDYKSFASRSDFDTALHETIRHINPDLIVLAGFMRILAADVVTEYAGKMINIHPSLLPAYPGLNTYQRALDAGEQWHGTTVHFVIPELDAGPAMLQYRVAIAPDDSAQSLAARVQQGEYRIYPQAIGMLASGQLKLDNGIVYSNGQKLAAPLVINETDLH